MATLGKYELHELLGKGGFGTVYRAVDTSLEREVALKILHPQLMVDEQFVERFRREARTLASLEHPNIVTIHELGEADGRVFIVMQYLAGGSLQEMIRKDGPLPYRKCLEVLEQVCDGLQSAHEKGLVHRDMKPLNILFNQKGQAVISDFGLARAVQASSASSSLGTAGTPAYRAPELWRGKPPASPATDVYSLGCVLAEMLTGRELFAGSTPDEIIARHLVDGPDFPETWPGDVPGQAVTALKRSISRDPAGRQPDAARFWEDLNAPSPAAPSMPAAASAGAAKEKKPGQKAPAGDLLEVEIAPGITMQFVRVPAGKFPMGSEPDDEDVCENEMPRHTVHLDEYWIGKYTVTNRQFLPFIESTTAQPPEYWEGSVPPEDIENHPLAMINWHTAGEFCSWLSLQSGLDIRLPSEAEWEKAARGTHGRRYPWGNQAPDESLCNFGNIYEGPTRVGALSPMGDSPYGCADMAGNVWEWAADVYQENYYARSPESNPTGPKGGGESVLRGGSWEDDAYLVRCAARAWEDPDAGDNNIGFRCCLHKSKQETIK